MIQRNYQCHCHSRIRQKRRFSICVIIFINKNNSIISTNFPRILIVNSEMAILHRALFTWFIFLVFLILLCLRLESRTHWNWFIVFIPMWVYDSILLIYVLFHMISHCRNGIERFRGTINKHVWYIAAIGLKMAAQIIICIKLEYTKGNLPIYVVMTPIWMLLPVLSVEVFMHLIKHSSGSSRY